MHASYYQGKQGSQNLGYSVCLLILISVAFVTGAPPVVHSPKTPMPKPPEKMTIDKTFAYALSIVVPIVMTEQTFLTSFLQMEVRKQNSAPEEYVPLVY